MAGIMDFLQAAVTAGNQAKGAYTDRSVGDTQSLIQFIQQQRAQQMARERQAALDAQNADLHRAQMRNIDSEIKARETPKPDQVAIHKAERDYDIAHPLPQTPSYTFPTGTDEEGKPIVLRGNTKTGTLERTEIGRPATGQAGQREAAQISVAQNQVAEADKIMRAFEEKLLSGERTIGTAEAAAAKAALAGGPLLSTISESAVNKMSPDLAGYVRAAKAVASAERLITPRGGSNALMQAEGMLSGAGPHANADLVRQAQEYRHALVQGLVNHGSVSTHSSAAVTAPHTTPLQEKYDAAYHALSQQGKDDAAIKAIIGERP